MNINYRETQYNFLENAPVSSRDPSSPRVMAAQLTLSIENLVILTIISIMVLLFCFSLGVEKGKRIALSDARNAEAGRVPAVQAVSVKGVSTEEDDVIAAGEAKQNIFEAFMASWHAKAQAPAPEAQPAADSPVPEPKSVKQAIAPVQAKGAKTVPSASAVAAGQAVSSGAYTVQVATYKSEKFAKREAENLKQKGYRDVYMLPKGSFVIVCVGSFSKKSDASTFTRQLKNRYQDTVVRRL